MIIVYAFSNQEPAFEELILLYTEEVGEGESKYKSEVPSLQLKIYERIPIPDLPVKNCYTHKYSHVLCFAQVICITFLQFFLYAMLEGFSHEFSYGLFIFRLFFLTKSYLSVS